MASTYKDLVLFIYKGKGKETILFCIYQNNLMLGNINLHIQISFRV